MLERLVVGGLNHLLGEEDWARSRLKPFAGRCARFELGPMALTVQVGADGMLALPSTPVGEADVCIRLPDDTPFRLAIDRDSVFGSARLTGSADFAEALGFVLRNLRWDIEADLARVVGDAAAHRAVRTASSLLAAQKDGVSRLGANLVEYAADEAGWLLRPQQLAHFSREVALLREALERLESRVSRL